MILSHWSHAYASRIEAYSQFIGQDERCSDDLCLPSGRCFLRDTGDLWRVQRWNGQCVVVVHICAYVSPILRQDDVSSKLVRMGDELGNVGQV